MSAEGFEPLSRAECLRLLAGARVGRVVFTELALSAALPVNFVANRHAAGTCSDS